MRTIILGVGNPILSDDGVGIHVVNELKKHIKNLDVKIEEAHTGGMNLLDLILGYDKAIIIDAIKTNESERNGEVKRINLRDISTTYSCNPHDISLSEALELAKQLGEERIPKEIILIGITMKKMPCEFGEKLTEEIAAAVPRAVEITLHEINNDMKSSN